MPLFIAKTFRAYMYDLLQIDLESAWHWTRYAYSSYATGPTSVISRGPCLPHSQICTFYKTCEIDECSLSMQLYSGQLILILIQPSFYLFQTKTGVTFVITLIAVS
jgi:hypothetical protein